MKLNRNINYFEMYDSPFQDLVKKYLKERELGMDAQDIPYYIHKKFNRSFIKAVENDRLEFSFSIVKYPLQSIFFPSDCHRLGEAVAKLLRKKMRFANYSTVSGKVYCHLGSDTL